MQKQWCVETGVNTYQEIDFCLLFTWWQIIDKYSCFALLLPCSFISVVDADARVLQLVELFAILTTKYFNNIE